MSINCTRGAALTFAAAAEQAPGDAAHCIAYL
jgi:hypothetical protein